MKIHQDGWAGVWRVETRWLRRERRLAVEQRSISVVVIKGEFFNAVEFGTILSRVGGMCHVKSYTAKLKF